MSAEEVLHGLTCSVCREEGQLVLDMVRGLVECRCCGARGLAGRVEDWPDEEYEEYEEYEDFDLGMDLYEDEDLYDEADLYEEESGGLLDR